MNRWNTIYPVYLDAKKPYGSGRRVSRDHALWWPLSTDIANAASKMGLSVVHEVDKSHPRDWDNPGRVRVLWKQNGKLVNHQFTTSMQRPSSALVRHMTCVHREETIGRIRSSCSTNQTRSRTQRAVQLCKTCSCRCTPSAEVEVFEGQGTRSRTCFKIIGDLIKTQWPDSTAPFGSRSSPKSVYIFAVGRVGYASRGGQGWYASARDQCSSCNPRCSSTWYTCCYGQGKTEGCSRQAIG
jgi:signal recognition particle subunit SEC65